MEKEGFREENTERMTAERSSTLDYYDQNAAGFYSTTANVQFTQIQDWFLSYLEPGARILDFGCGSGRDSKYFLSKGYEIADMLGKVYNEGMRINADFVLDESLEPGTRIITSITKPQVIYNGELIQKAIVTVTQNI